MIEWSESQLRIRDAVRRFVESEIPPHVEELEHGDDIEARADQAAA